MANDDGDSHYRVVIDRANETVRQSKALRKIADERLKENKGLRANGQSLNRKTSTRTRARPRSRK